MVWQWIGAAALIGHFGLHLAIYNRLNSCGLRRRTIKQIEMVFVLTTVLIPIIFLWLYTDECLDIATGRVGQLPIPASMASYGIVCLLAWLVFGIPWLLWRPILRLEWADAPRKVEVVHVDQVVGKPLARTSKCKWESRLPLNQLFDLAIEQVELPVLNLPKSLDGYRIAQISDVHLTGHIEPDYIRYAVERATAWGPELFTLTGDIIDKQMCVDWLFDIFSPADARDGRYFILGNHDTRIVDPSETRDAMHRAGWNDLGPRVHRCQLRGVPTALIGNEYPWFGRPEMSGVQDGDFRLLLSHSPDQITWARKHQVHLMLAGHTHGGQGRLPLIGPVLSPSFHGSRFASGDFVKPPTTMHVTRGLGGVHLMRINCRPELSLITLRQHQSTR
tara:strand:- start:31917 stop:33086 length:1170 start_codon:yes stop_codon:yes gene_type:complete